MSYSLGESTHTKKKNLLSTLYENKNFKFTLLYQTVWHLLPVLTQRPFPEGNSD